jgi:UDP-N-acetylmuramoyl-tripeptide--D-alanyl-D-alanine ligase
MIRLSGAEVAGILGGDLVDGDPTNSCDRVTIDSREAGPGVCFFAIVGPRDDGHRYLPQSIAAGARILVIQRREALPHLDNPTAATIVVVEDTTAALQRLAVHVRRTIAPLVIAITGSVGKTTTKALTSGLLHDSGPTLATPGNFNNHWGLPLSLLGLEEGHQWMVAELGMSAAGEIGFLTALAQPDIAVITNVAPVHMENFASVAGVAAAKRELAEGLDPSGTLIVNADNAWTAAIGNDFDGRVSSVLRFGTGEDADVRATAVEGLEGGWKLDLHYPGEPVASVTLPLAGEHSIANFLAAAAVAHAVGIDAATVATRTPGLLLPPMRGQMRRSDDDIAVIDDSYNASPAAMLSAIETLAGASTSGRRILAAGDMLELGSWSEDAHREIGLHAAAVGIDMLITVGPLARDLASGAAAGGMPATAIRSFGASLEAAEEIRNLVRSGDVVLIKGSRGIRMERLTRALLDHQPESA